MQVEGVRTPPDQALTSPDNPAKQVDMRMARLREVGHTHAGQPYLRMPGLILCRDRGHEVGAWAVTLAVLVDLKKDVHSNRID